MGGADQHENDKQSLLRREGVLHPHPQAVSAPLFRDNAFFDPHDLVQVKYEMLRRVQCDQTPVGQAAHEAGLSRPSFYQAQAGFQHSGLAGLVPRKPGPRGAHKLLPQVLAFVRKTHSEHPEWKDAQLAEQVRAEFGVQIHPRTIRRALDGRQKKRR